MPLPTINQCLRKKGGRSSVFFSELALSSRNRQSATQDEPTIVGMVADRMSHEEILRAYPDLEADDIREALALAAEEVRQ